MQTRKDTLDALSDFKLARDAMIHADNDEFVHQLRLFVKQLDRNPLCTQVLAGLPAFDVDSWWSKQTEGRESRYTMLDALDLPENKDTQLAIYLNFARSFASTDREQMSAEDFGSAFGKHKRADALGVARSVILRPLADELTRRIREVAAMTNPDVRDLAGVPLSWIPSENELGIFLSHKWVNKDLVRRYHRVLQDIGFKPWLDEEEVAAGDILHRVLADGMDNSCAAVFFVTSAFKDERWLGQEVDLAINRKVDRAEKFQIITLVFGDVEIPKPLQRYVYARVDNDLDGLRAIIRGLPIELGPARWKEKVVADKKGP